MSRTLPSAVITYKVRPAAPSAGGPVIDDGDRRRRLAGVRVEPDDAVVVAEIVTTGQRAVPARALERGFAFRHTDLEQALRDALA